MKLQSRFRRKARIREDEIDTAMFAPAGRENYYGPYEEMPIYYVVTVQVRCWFLWLTIWEESVDVTDADARNIIFQRARRVLQCMQKCE